MKGPSCRCSPTDRSQPSARTSGDGEIRAVLGGRLIWRRASAGRLSIVEAPRTHVRRIFAEPLCSELVFADLLHDRGERSVELANLGFAHRYALHSHIVLWSLLSTRSDCRLPTTGRGLLGAAESAKVHIDRRRTAGAVGAGRREGLLQRVRVAVGDTRVSDRLHLLRLWEPAAVRLAPGLVVNSDVRWAADLILDVVGVESLVAHTHFECPILLLTQDRHDQHEREQRVRFAEVVRSRLMGNDMA